MKRLLFTLITIALIAGLTLAAWGWIGGDKDLLLNLAMGLACLTGGFGLFMGVFLAHYLMSAGADLATNHARAYGSADAAGLNLQRTIVRTLGRGPQQQLPPPARDWGGEQAWLPPLQDFEIIDSESDLEQ